MQIRPPKYGEITQCCNLVYENWGEASAERCREQMIEYFKGGPYAPTFMVADIGPGMPVIGFAAFAPTMLMKDVYDLIWVAVDEFYKSKGVGKALTERRLAEIVRKGGVAAQLVTQKPDYFKKFGFMPLYPLGNDWTLMLKRFGNASMG